MSNVLSVSDGSITCYAVIELTSGDPIYISVAQSGVLVKKSRIGLLGPVLYKEKVVYQAAMTAKALCYLYQECKLPGGFTNPVLRAFANAVLHCETPGEVSVILNEAIARAEKDTGTTIEDLLVLGV